MGYICSNELDDAVQVVQTPLHESVTVISISTQSILLGSAKIFAYQLLLWCFIRV